jgi:hypothetical protein
MNFERDSSPRGVGNQVVPTSHIHFLSSKVFFDPIPFVLM